MKNDLLPLLDTLLLRKPFIIETLFDKLKSAMGLERTRHCCSCPSIHLAHLDLP